MNDMLLNALTTYCNILDSTVALLVALISVILIFLYKKKTYIYSIACTGTVGIIAGAYIYMDDAWTKLVQAQIVKISTIQDISWTFFECVFMCTMLLLILRIFKLENTIQLYVKMLNAMKFKNIQKDILNIQDTKTQSFRLVDLQRELSIKKPQFINNWDNKYISSLELIIASIIALNFLLALCLQYFYG